jgi:hypothetical protein
MLLNYNIYNDHIAQPANNLWFEAGDKKAVAVAVCDELVDVGGVRGVRGVRVHMN